MDKTDQELLKNDPDLAAMFTDDEGDSDDLEDDVSTTSSVSSSNFNFGRSRGARRSQNRLGLVFSKTNSFILRYSTLLYATLRYSTLRYSTLLYATLRYSTLLYATLR
jgi:hypothetical protein